LYYQTRPFYKLCTLESVFKNLHYKEKFMRLRGLLLLCLFVSASGQANELKPFATDGCSLWIDGTPEQPNLWRHCCVAHDLAYWQGGSEATRKQADDDIQACVTEAQGKGMGNYIYTNVRWGGSPYWMNYYRWGYGWDYFDGMWPRGYKVPTPDEQKQIDQAMPAALKVVAQDAIENPTKATEDNNASNGN
jgi:hypothetical protein